MRTSYHVGNTSDVEFLIKTTVIARICIVRGNLTHTI
jgi:hypothetical protein